MELHIEHINEHAPYKVAPYIYPGYVVFSTDFDVRLAIGFEKTDLIQSDEAYEFMIVNVDHTSSPGDPKVRETVRYIVDEFFSANENTLLYLCETEDGHQAARNRLFQDWFSRYDRKEDFVFLSASVTDEDGVVNYATVIAKNSNPHLDDIISEFYATIKLFQEKPKQR